MQFEVVYALPNEQPIFTVNSETTISIRQAIHDSGILTKYPQLVIEELKIGVFGRICALDDYLEDGDRVEIYRPLIISPIDARRIRAEKKRKTGQTSRFGA